MNAMTATFMILALCPGIAEGFWGQEGFGGQAKGPQPPADESAIISVSLGKQLVPVRVQNRTVAHKTAYFGSVHAGNPAQNFTVVFDTGSGHFILPSSMCKSATCALHRRYSRALSASAQDIEHDGTLLKPGAKERDQVAISFGTGEITGEFVEEVVCLDKPHDPATQGEEKGCTRLRAVLATEMTDDPFQLFSFDGVLGLGLEALALNPSFSFFGQMSRGHAAMAPVFAVHLGQGEEDSSEISFGGHRRGHLAAGSSLLWTPVASPQLGYWQVAISGISIGGRAIEMCKDGSCRAIVDTGTSLLGVPKHSAKELHWLLARPVENYTPELDCRGMAGPTISFDMGNFTVDLDAKDYSRPVPARMTRDGATEPEVFCRASMLPVDMKVPMSTKTFIFGEPVLRRYYTAFNWVTKEIGFGVAASERRCEPGASCV